MPARVRRDLFMRRDSCAVVETSANYMGGNSELLVGEGIDRWRASGNSEGNILTVVSKFGYASVSVHQLGMYFEVHVSVLTACLLQENKRPISLDHRLHTAVLPYRRMLAIAIISERC